MAHVSIKLGEICLSSERLGDNLSLLQMLLSLEQFLLAILAFPVLLELPQISYLPFVKSLDFSSYLVLLFLQLLLLVFNRLPVDLLESRVKALDHCHCFLFVLQVSQNEKDQRERQHEAWQDVV